jgi:hypothetical protein
LFFEVFMGYKVYGLELSNSGVKLWRDGTGIDSFSVTVPTADSVSMRSAMEEAFNVLYKRGERVASNVDLSWVPGTVSVQFFLVEIL